MSRKRSRKFDTCNRDALRRMSGLYRPYMCNYWKEEDVSYEYVQAHVTCITYTLPNRDIVQMYFSTDNGDDDFTMQSEYKYWVGLYIGPRQNKDRNMDGLSTGRCGMKGLVIARQMLLHYILKRLRPGQTIFVGGADGRRFRIYEYWLGKLGFRRTNYRGESAMMFTRPLDCDWYLPDGTEPEKCC